VEVDLVVAVVDLAAGMAAVDLAAGVAVEEVAVVVVVDFMVLVLQGEEEEEKEELARVTCMVPRRLLKEWLMMS
jgi:hypothetical protein